MATDNHPRCGALVFFSPSSPGELRQMGGGKVTLAGSISPLAPPKERDRWREWLGTVAWSRIERADRIVIERLPLASCPSPSS